MNLSVSFHLLRMSFENYLRCMFLERYIFSLYPVLYLVALKQVILAEIKYSLESINLWCDK